MRWCLMRSVSHWVAAHQKFHEAVGPAQDHSASTPWPASTTRSPLAIPAPDSGERLGRLLLARESRGRCRAVAGAPPDRASASITAGAELGDHRSWACPCRPTVRPDERASGSPASSTVGISAPPASRAGAVTAKALILPPAHGQRIGALIERHVDLPGDQVLHPLSRPAIRHELEAVPVSRNRQRRSTCSTRCRCPEVPIVALPGLALSQAMKPLRLFAGTELLARIRSGWVEDHATGSKSVTEIVTQSDRPRR